MQSATVGQQVDLFLRTSDNYLTEAIGRMAAVVSGRPGSNQGAVAAVLQQLEQLKIPAGTLRAADVSGLALANQVSARQLSEVVRAITSGADTRLRAGLAGFPVAGLTGTLGDRYLDAATARGAGLVRAKTGTLNTVIALSGYVVDADGRLLVFSFIGNGLTPGAANKAALDRTAVRPGRLRLPLTRPCGRRPAQLQGALSGPCDLMERMESSAGETSAQAQALINWEPPLPPPPA